MSLSQDENRLAMLLLGARSPDRAISFCLQRNFHLARVVADNVKEDGRRSREAVKAAAAQTAREMQALSADVQAALAALAEAATAPRREIVQFDDARRSLHMQTKHLAGGGLLHTSLRRNHRSEAEIEHKHIGRSDDCIAGTSQLKNVMPVSLAEDPVQDVLQVDSQYAPAARVPVRAVSVQHELPMMSPPISRQMSTRQPRCWPQVSEYRMPVPALGQSSIAASAFEEKGHGGGSGDGEADDGDDVFLDDGPLEVRGLTEARCDSDDGTVAPWEIGDGRGWKAEIVEKPPTVEKDESAGTPEKELKAKSLTGVREADRQIARRRSSRRRSKQ